MSARNRLGAIVLIASLALNGLLSAYVAVSWLERARGALWPATPRALLTVVAERLPADDRRLMLEAIDAHSAQLEATSGEFVDARVELARLLKAPALDGDELVIALRAVRDSRVPASDAVFEIFADAVPRMSQGTRMKIADAFGVD